MYVTLFGGEILRNKKGPNIGTLFTKQLNKNQTTQKLIIITIMESKRLLRL
jgi:hypothetical protein